MTKKLISRSRAVLNKQLKAFFLHRRRKITQYTPEEAERLIDKIPAYHEAGHATIAFACDMPVEEITIYKDELSDIPGKIIVGTHIWSIMETKARKDYQEDPEIRSHIMQCLAGAGAVELFLGVNVPKLQRPIFYAYVKS
jgi:hypothetical protein